MKVKSKKPGKQRKALFKAKNHQRSKLLSTRLVDFLQDEYGIKRLPLRVGDSVRVTTGEFKDFEGSIMEINRKKLRVKIKECVFEKVDGTQYYPTIHVSNLLITKFVGVGKKMDVWRSNMIERKASFGTWEEGLKAPKKEKEEGKK